MDKKSKKKNKNTEKQNKNKLVDSDVDESFDEYSDWAENTEEEAMEWEPESEEQLELEKVFASPFQIYISKEMEKIIYAYYDHALVRQNKTKLVDFHKKVN